jgi:hypothetical protein
MSADLNHARRRGLKHRLAHDSVRKRPLEVELRNRTTSETISSPLNQTYRIWSYWLSMTVRRTKPQPGPAAGKRGRHIRLHYVLQGQHIVLTRRGRRLD